MPQEPQAGDWEKYHRPQGLRPMSAFLQNSFRGDPLAWNGSWNGWGVGKMGAWQWGGGL